MPRLLGKRLMAQGLRFECQPGCTACCRQQGFVYLTEEDLIRIAGFLGMSAAEFERKYVYRTRNLQRLRVPRASRCHFLSDAGCGIHPAKPTQCRIFPFWPELVESRREWRKTARYCPGMGSGPFIQIETSRELSNEMREAYPGLY
jgi:Fe-S-cluster containining protein